MKTLPVYDHRYIKTKIRKFGDQVYTNFCGLNVPEDDIECIYFNVLSVHPLLVYDNKYYLQVYCSYKIVNKQMTHYADENSFEDLIL